MKALRTWLSTNAIALLIACGFSSPSIAGSSDFSGIYGAFWGSAGGAQVDGTHTTGRDNTGASQLGDVTSGKVGGVFPLAGVELGFNFPLGDSIFIGVGASKTQGGTAMITRGESTSVQTTGDGRTGGAGQDNGNNSDFSLSAKNLQQVYIMPSISIYDNSAIYIKLGRSIADTEVSGNVTGVPNNLMGSTYGIGTIAMTESGLFLKTEGTFTEFDDIRIVGVNGTNALVEGDPTVVAGTVAIGFKF